jgi:hypothetical protein
LRGFFVIGGNVSSFRPNGIPNDKADLLYAPPKAILASRRIALQPDQKFRPARKAAIEKEEDRRRRKRRQREDEYRRRIERLRRQIEEARRRRRRVLLLLLLAVLPMQESLLATFQRSFAYQRDYDPEPANWTPDPRNDFAAQPGHDDHCDGYSREEWTQLLSERGIKLSRKTEMKAAWEVDPERALFPERYQLWGTRPYIGQIMAELTAPYWRADAFMALQLLSPPETHQYLAEAHATDPGDLRQCLADRDADTIRVFHTRAILWEERKRREAEKMQRLKSDRKQDDDEKNFDP